MLILPDFQAEGGTPDSSLIAGEMRAFHNRPLTGCNLGIRVVKTKYLFLLVFTHSQYCQKRLLRDIYFADPLHPFLALFLLFEQLAFA